MSKFQVTLKNKQQQCEKQPEEWHQKDEVIHQTETTTLGAENDTGDSSKSQSEQAPKKEPVVEARGMTTMSTDKIVAIGLVTMGIMSISGYIAYVLYTGNSNGTEIPMAIVSGLTGFLGRGALINETTKTTTTSTSSKGGPTNDNGKSERS